ncbi:MAG: DUF2156 domain-containing protein [Lentisphaeria bacterium]|nr:DUF2156 domain-containing protein [Lentisphaeria bacterium]
MSFIPSFPPFSPEKFIPLAECDLEKLRFALLRSMEQSCEFALANLYTWKDFCQTKVQFWQDRLYIWFSQADLMIFTVDREKKNEPSAKELFSVASAMKKTGRSGKFYQVRKDTLENDPAFPEFFRIEPGSEDTAEYIYEVEKLALLPGSVLSKKRNLIHQFRRAHPEAKSVLLDRSNYSKAKALAEEWYAFHGEESHDLAGEKSALQNMEGAFRYAGLTGVLVEEGDKVLAFAAAAPITETIWTETLEKSLPQYKGAAQFANNELAKLLQGKCLLLNREQDLGLPGLKQAKLSYLPEFLLRNFVLTPIE